MEENNNNIIKKTQIEIQNEITNFNSVQNEMVQRKPDEEDGLNHENLFPIRHSKDESISIDGPCLNQLAEDMSQSVCQSSQNNVNDETSPKSDKHVTDKHVILNINRTFDEESLEQAPPVPVKPPTAYQTSNFDNQNSNNFDNQTELPGNSMPHANEYDTLGSMHTGNTQDKNSNPNSRQNSQHNQNRSPNIQISDSGPEYRQNAYDANAYPTVATTVCWKLRTPKMPKYGILVKDYLVFNIIFPAHCTTQTHHPDSNKNKNKCCPPCWVWCLCCGLLFLIPLLIFTGMWFGGFFCGSAALPFILPSDNSTEVPETTSKTKTTIPPAPTTISPVDCLKDGDLINFQNSIEKQIFQNFEKVMFEMGKNSGGNEKSSGDGKQKNTGIPQKIVDYTSHFNTINNNINNVDNSVQSMADKMLEMNENMKKVTNKLESMEKKNQNLVSKINSMSERFESKFSSISSSVSALSEQLSKMQEASANAWSSFNRTSVILPVKNQESCKCEERKCECNCNYEGNSSQQQPVIIDPASIKIDLPKDHWLWTRLIDIETKVCYAINELHYLRNVKNDKRIENKSYDVRSHYDSINDKEVMVEKSQHEQHRANNIEMIHHRAAIASRKRRNLN